MSTPYFEVQFENASGFDDSQVYLLGTAFEVGATDTTDQSFIQFDTTTGQGTLVTATDGESAAPYTVQLSDFPVSSEGAYLLQFPPLESGRIHLSLGAGLCLLVNTNTNGAVVINDPSQADPGVPNYFIIWDKFEFTFDPSGSPPGNPIWINPTAVDFFGLPLTLTLSDGQGPVGLPQQSRSDVVSRLTSALTGPWADLVLTYGNGNDATVLRVTAPNESPVDSDGNPIFPSDYLAPSLQAIWTYYQTNSLEIESDGVIYTGTVDDDMNFNFTAAGSPPDLPVVQVPLPTSADVFACTMTATSEASPPASDTAATDIPRVLETALNVGILPLAPGSAPLQSPSWTAADMPQYYTNPQLSTVLWNSYAAAIHDNGTGNDGNQIYAFAYDDQAGQSGLLQAAPGTVATITLNDCSGLTLPVLTGGPSWTVTFQTGEYASGSVSSGGNTTSLPAQASTEVAGITSGFTLNYDSTGSPVDYTVYLVATPGVGEGAAASACPQGLGINVASVSGSDVTLQLPGGPPPSA